MEKRLNQLYLGLGSNLGDKIENIEQALVLIHAEIGVITKKSTYYFSQPQGFISENDFVNLVIMVETDRTPFDVLAEIERIEKVVGPQNRMVFFRIGSLILIFCTTITKKFVQNFSLFLTLLFFNATLFMFHLWKS